MQFQVVSISPERKQSKGKNVWFEFDLKFNTQKGEQDKTFRSFEDVYKDAKILQPGDKVNAVVVKDGNYWNWKEIQVIENPGNQDPKEEKTSKSTKVSTWETAEERQQKQTYIIRQSCLSTAVALLAAEVQSKGVIYEAKQVIELAKQFEDFVFGKENENEEKSKTSTKAKKIKEAVKEAGQDDIPF